MIFPLLLNTLVFHIFSIMKVKILGLSKWVNIVRMFLFEIPHFMMDDHNFKKQNSQVPLEDQ